MVNPVEAFFNVGVQGILGFEPDEIEDGFDGILRAASRSKTIGVGFKPGFPLRL